MEAKFIFRLLDTFLINLKHWPELSLIVSDLFAQTIRQIEFAIHEADCSRIAPSLQFRGPLSLNKKDKEHLHIIRDLSSPVYNSFLGVICVRVWGV